MGKKIVRHIKEKQNLHENFNMKILGQKLFLGEKNDNTVSGNKRESTLSHVITGSDFQQTKQLDIKDSQSRGLNLSCIKKDYFFIFEKRTDESN